MTDKKTIYMVVPCYNEVQNIIPFWELVKETFSGQHYEVIFINDGKIILTSNADNLRTKENSSIDEIFRRMFKC